VSINGYSQTGASQNTLATGNNAVLKVQLNGTNAGPVNGLTIEASDSTITGLVINRFRDDGVVIIGSGATGNRIQGNFIGTNAAGTQDLGNSSDGVDILDAPDNTIGGTVAGARNVISGNDDHGVAILRSSATGNKVLGNYIGADKNGTADLGNTGNGVNVDDAPDNTIGGTAAGARNIISGNGIEGVLIADSDATSNEVEGNFIGTNAAGSADLGNSSDGVVISSASNNTIGGTAAGARNVISGNDNRGVLIFEPSATDNKVEGNFIGTNAAGSADLGNARDGVNIFDARNNTIGGTVGGARNIISGNGGNGADIFGADATGNKVLGNRIGTKADGTGDLGNGGFGVNMGNASNNTVGDTASGAGNVISGNGDNGQASGVGIFGPLATGNKVEGNTIRLNGLIGVLISGGVGNSILSNRIFDNGGLGIDFDADGVTNNDTKDPDTGANNRQNFPVITSATQSSTTFPVRTTIQGTLNSNPNQSFTVQCFVADGDSSGHGEGEKLAGQDTSVTTDTNGDASFTCTTFVATQGGRTAVTATATNTATGNTSEFSDNVVVSSGR
jgi:titin